MVCKQILMLIMNTDLLLLKKIINSSRDAIFVLDISLQIIHWTNPANDIFKFDESEILNQPFLDLLVQENYKNDLKNEIEKYIDCKPNLINGELLEIYGKRKDNLLFQMELKIERVQIQDKIFLICISRDVTNSKHYEGELTKLIEDLQVTKEYVEQNANDFLLLNVKLIESEERLEILNSNKDRFFSIIAHDLKGPFQSLLGYSELLKDSASDFTSEQIMEFASSLHSSAKNLFKLLENLLSWSSIQRGKIEYIPKLVNLKLCISNNFELIAPRAKMKGVNLINNALEDKYAFCDVDMLDTVIRNLLSNAIKFTKNGDSISINLLPSITNNYKIEVKDTGLGMTEEIKNKLFNLGTKVTTLGTENEVGTGLGLLLCKELVELNKGKIWVESELNQGSSFIFTLPISEEISL